MRSFALALYVARDPRPRIGTRESNRLSLALNHQRETMKDQCKPADRLQTIDPSISDTEDDIGEDTRRMRSLTVQEIEQILREEASKKPRS